MSRVTSRIHAEPSVPSTSADSVMMCECVGMLSYSLEMSLIFPYTILSAQTPLAYANESFPYDNEALAGTAGRWALSGNLHFENSSLCGAGLPQVPSAMQNPGPLQITDFHSS